jgi:hypothetical protein
MSKRNRTFINWGYVGVLLCLHIALLLPLLIFPAKAGPEPGMVYCPLQKKWVKGSKEEPVKPSVDLGALCISDKNKATLLKVFIKESVTIPDESFVFEILKDGIETAIKNQRLPSKPSPLAFKTASSIGTVSSREKSRIDILWLGTNLTYCQQPVGLTTRVNTFFDRRIFLALKPVYQGFNPRPPPIFV